jgi:hypothetical protein
VAGIVAQHDKKVKPFCRTASARPSTSELPAAKPSLSTQWLSIHSNSLIDALTIDFATQLPLLGESPLIKQPFLVKKRQKPTFYRDFAA